MEVEDAVEVAVAVEVEVAVEMEVAMKVEEAVEVEVAVEVKVAVEVVNNCGFVFLGPSVVPVANVLYPLMMLLVLFALYLFVLWF